MSKFNRKDVSIVFALALLFTSLLLVNLKLPTVAQSEEPIYLHGPSLTPIHMHSNESLRPIHMNSNMTLTPVHMHYVGDPGIDPIYEPILTPWHELYPEFCQEWHLTSWEDYNGDGLLSPNDQIDMTNEETGNVTWYHVDRITWTLLLSNESDPEDIMFVEFKGPPDVEDPIHFPVCTLWHEVWPSYSNVYHIINWYDNGNEMLDFCDYIDLEDINTGITVTWHVEDVATDLILREKIMDPRCTWWHEIYPNYCKWWHLSSWEDDGWPEGQLSPGDQIDMIDEETGEKTWYYVDRVTLTLNVTYGLETVKWMKIELKTRYFEEMYEALKHPNGTWWHEIYPHYSNVYNLTGWDWFEGDNCNGVLDACDYIVLINMSAPEWPEVYCHVEDVCYDIILNKKIMDPICTTWHEVYPNYSNYHHVTSWEEPLEDPYPNRLSPGDQIDMNNTETGEISWYHVDRVTLTLNLSNVDYPEEVMYIELKDVPFEEIYWVKIKPEWTMWHEVWPEYSPVYYISHWADNCNGVLDYCDVVELQDEGGVSMGYWHVEDLAIDIILNEKITDPVCTWWHELYPIFCNEYHITGWEDNGDGLLSPCDWIDLDPLGTGYHVENVTITLNVTLVGEPGVYYYFEYMGPFESMYQVKTDPVCTDWMMIGGEGHGEIMHCDDWIDNCNGVLDYCDQILLSGEWCHIEEVAIDIVVKKPIHDVAVTYVASRYPWVYQGLIDPIDVTVVNEGDYTETVDIYAFYDSNQAAPKQTVVLNPGQSVTLTFSWLTKGVPTGWYVISANATIPVDDDPADNVRVGNEEQVRLPPPLYWKEAYPDYAPSGMPDFDQRQVGTYPWQEPWSGNFEWSHCAPVAAANSLWWYDSKFEINNVPPPAIVDNYPLVTSYNPGVWDDHDPQNVQPLVEHLAYLMDTDGMRTGIQHIGTNVWDVQAGIAQYLSWSGVNPLGDVNGDGTVNQTDVDIVNAAMGSTPGAPNWDMRADIHPVTLEYPPIADNIIDDNDLNLVMANLGLTGTFYEQTVQAPDFQFIEKEIKRSEDVIFMLGFWYFDGESWIREEYPYPYESGHCVTAAGVNSTTMQIAISDPIQDNAEAGGPGRVYPPPPHPHPPSPPDTVHNDASYISHDIYNVTWISPPLPPCPGGNWTLINYTTPQIPLVGYTTVIEWAVTVSPLVPDIAVTNLTICYGQTVVPQAPPIVTWINVTVTNEGQTNEAFKLTLYWNTTNVIASANVSLLVGETKIIRFMWDTSTLQRYANYTLSAYATPVLGETDIVDNSFLGDTVVLVIPGDFDADKDVDLYDAVALLTIYGAKIGDPQYDPNKDIDNDGDIDLYDAVALLTRYGQKEP